MIERERGQWSPRERADFDARGFRARRSGEWPLVAGDVRPDDYAHDLKRGSVEHVPGWRNYCYHVVTMPAGAVVRGANFSQSEPDTVAIIAMGALTLIECNLCNVRLDPAWQLVRCNTVQSWIVRRNGDEERQFICSHPAQLPSPLTPPSNAVRSRGF